jgi:hypothetical protein
MSKATSLRNELVKAVYLIYACLGLERPQPQDIVLDQAIAITRETKRKTRVDRATKERDAKGIRLLPQDVDIHGYVRFLVNMALTAVAKENGDCKNVEVLVCTCMGTKFYIILKCRVSVYAVVNFIHQDKKPYKLLKPNELREKWLEVDPADMH